MSEVITDYFKQIYNFFHNFSKAKFYKVLKKIGYIFLFILLSLFAVSCYLTNRYGKHRARNKLTKFPKRKRNKIIFYILLFLSFISLWLFTIPMFYFYVRGYRKEFNILNDSIDNKKMELLTGIHTSSFNELISISECNLKKQKVDL